MLNRVLPRLTMADFAKGVDPAKEKLAMLLDHLADPRAFHDFGADPEDFHDPPPVRTRAAGAPAARDHGSAGNPEDASGGLSGLLA